MLGEGVGLGEHLVVVVEIVALGEFGDGGGGGLSPAWGMGYGVEGVITRTGEHGGGRRPGRISGTC